MVKDIALDKKTLMSVTTRVLAAMGVLVVSTGVAVVGYFNPVTAGFFPLCPLHEMTGLNCPGCGMTRGFHAFFNGDILDALHYNALLPLVAFVCAYLVISLSLMAIRGRGLSWKIFHPTVLLIILGVLLTFGVVRNLPFYPFNLLAI